MTKVDAGKLGGAKTRDNHISLCPLCGTPVKNGYLAELGKKGGETTLQKHGREFYVAAGRLGGRGNRREKRNGREGIVSHLPADKDATIGGVAKC